MTEDQVPIYEHPFDRVRTSRDGLRLARPVPEPLRRPAEPDDPDSPTITWVSLQFDQNGLRVELLTDDDVADWHETKFADLSLGAPLPHEFP